MPIDVVMPQMGESIAEGTVIKWMKKVGDKVERDEPLFEISTDKVDAEIPAPANGTVAEILVTEGQTVPVNAVVARLSTDGEAAGSSAPAAAAPEPAPAPAASSQAAAPAAAPVAAPAPPPPAAAAPAAADDADKVSSLEERRRTRSSPLVRKIAEENKVDITSIEGTGVSGRVTKNDILQFLEKPAAERQAPARAPQPASAPAARSSEAPPQHFPAFGPGENIEIEPMSVMRKRIADHMVVSKRTSAHVTTVFEVDFTAIDKLRRKHKDDYAARGGRLTYLPFIVQAVNTALREFPILNASTDGENIIYKKDVNIGIAVALEWGLIVPVLKNADEKNILGLAKLINDLGDRARTKKLNPDDVQGGTFTITNPGIYGGLFGTPIINQPQSAILGVGGVKKKPVVVETKEGDAIVIRSMCYLALTFDHRIIDGAVADQFMARVRAIIEAGQYAL